MWSSGKVRGISDKIKKPTSTHFNDLLVSDQFAKSPPFLLQHGVLSVATHDHEVKTSKPQNPEKKKSKKTDVRSFSVPIPSPPIIRGHSDSELNGSIFLDPMKEQEKEQIRNKVNSPEDISGDCECNSIGEVEVNDVTSVEDYWSETMEELEVSSSEPDIIIAQNEEDEAEKEIEIIYEWPEKPQIERAKFSTLLTLSVLEKKKSKKTDARSSSVHVPSLPIIRGHSDSELDGSIFLDPRKELEKELMYAI
ncbi:hypothetical protein Sjap_021646 [Stephania japonica]|uniref:Death domain-containing protein n=1 Tax=Stephania japonica TaxID=461633 RepID=A0AAP0HRS9_9MAGN